VRITTKECGPELWGDVEALFGPNGACGGCWCQWWRIEKGERWAAVKGTVAKRRLRKQVLSGAVHAIVAFDGETPVGWCTYGPRDSFPRLNRARTLACDDSASVWSVPCFFVARGHRGRGVAGAMLAHAVRAMKKRGVSLVEGYPSRPGSDGRYVAAFAWTGTESLFAKAGFADAGGPAASKHRVRKKL
jgi:GNAT superfamily N-acetyltransferase